MYYYGVDNGIGLRLLNFLQAAGTYPVNGLLGVANLNVFDSDGNRISTDTTVEDGNTGENGNNGNDDNNTNDNNGMDGGSDGGNGSGNGNGDGNGSGSDNGSGTSSQGGDSQGPVGGGDDNGSTNSNNDGTAEPDNTVAGAQGQEGESGADDGNSGLSKWSKILIGVSVATAFLGIIICLILHRFCCRRVDDDDDVGEKVDFDSLPPEQAIPRTVKAPSVIPAPTFLDDEDMSGFASPWPGSFGSNEEPGSPITQSGGTEVLMTQRGDTHVCNSATCEVCARNQQVRFLPTEPESFEELEQLPSDATRNYYVDDTVAL